MFKRFTILFSVFAMLLCLSAVAFGQERTGDIEITVKDPNGAIVPNASVTVASSGTADTGSTAGFKRTVTTNDEGFVRILQIPPGVYNVTVGAISGFAERTVPGVQVVLGKVTPVTVDLGVAGATGEITINTSDVAPIDPTDNKIQTNITAQDAELLPKGTNFTSLLKVSPSTRPEANTGGFQVDGASGSENTFIIDGQEVTNARTGTLDQNNNLPFQLIQEIQVKTSGFEAEYGGATGGVINLVTKGGGNDWRGEFGAQFRPSRLNPRTGTNFYFENEAGNIEFREPGIDKALGFFPTANLSGPIIKDRVWFFGSYTPQILTRQRTIDYYTSNPANPAARPFRTSETYSQKVVNEYTFLRLDAQPFNRLRLTGTYTWNPISQRGSVPGYGTFLDPLPAGNGLVGAGYRDQLGGRQNSQSVTGQVVWTPTNNLVLSFRGGHYFLNEKLNTYGLLDVSIPRVTCSAASPNPFPANFGCVRGFTNGLPVDSNTQFDATTRNTFDGDATYVAEFGGRHEFKGGYQYNGLANELLSTTRSQIVLRYGQGIDSYSGRNIQVSPTAVGAGLLRQFREQGDVSSKNEALFFQDKWQPVKRLTLNLGVRTERENVPSFNPQAPDLQFNFQDKIAPRIGVAYDLTGDGKTKIAGFYGWFYDRFKYELPRGSFGGAFFHDFYYEIFPGDTLATFSEANIVGGGVPTIGGACPGNTTTPIFGRVRCDIDYRVPSNSDLGIEFGAVDPDIKAFRQSEISFLIERDLGRNFVISGRYVRKNVDVAIEDAGFLTSTGSEAYIIGNPGRGLHAQVSADNDLLFVEPQRLYQAIEVRFDKRFSNNYYFNANYTWSRLYGNYSGLASSDEDGRTSPNVNRFFDLPHAGFTVAGGPDNGLLPTDRTHVFNFFGSYHIDWNKMFGFGNNNRTEFSAFTTVQSGTPLTTTVDILGIDTIVLTERGDLGRTEMFTQTDFSVRHRYRFGRDNRFTLVAEADVLNIFNENNVLRVQNLLGIENFDLTDPTLGLLTEAESQLPNAYPLAIRRFQENGALGTIEQRARSNPFDSFGFPSAYQGNRELRFGFRLLF